MVWKFVVFACLVHYVYGRKESFGTRIVGGQEVKDRKYFPYQVSLRFLHRHYCGGTIIDAQHILTAAHCCFDTKRNLFPAKAITAYVGDLNLNKPMNSSQRVGVKYIFTHKRYSPQPMTNDIAVLRLQTPLTFNEFVQPINFASALPPKNSPCVISGWGEIKQNYGRVSPVLNFVTVPILSQEECKKIYRHAIKWGMFCAGYLTGGYDSCQGDSGGPLVSNLTNLVGIVSWGVGCALSGLPGVYTDVSKYRDWVESQKKRSCSNTLSSSIFNTAVMFMLHHFVFSQ